MNLEQEETTKHLEVTDDAAMNRSVIILIMTYLKEYANKHSLMIYGFSDDFSEVVFVRSEGEHKETVRIPYAQVAQEVQDDGGY